MKDNEIKVQVVGVSGSGKTAIIEIINLALAKKGFDPKIIVPDGDFKFYDDNLDDKVEAIKSKQTNLVIEEVQANHEIK